MESLAFVGGIGVTAVVLVLVMLMYFALIFFVGLMFYYFTGTNKPGTHLLNNLMRVGARFYSHLWMLLSAFAALLGFSLFVRGIMGALFQEFVYGATNRFGFGVSPEQMQADDLQTGIILFVLALIIYLVHWGFAYMVETNDDRKGTVMTKILNTVGLFGTSFVFFGALIAFVFDLVAGTTAGSDLAWMLGAFPFWLFYALRVIWVQKNEVDDSKVAKPKS